MSSMPSSGSGTRSVDTRSPQRITPAARVAGVYLLVALTMVIGGSLMTGSKDASLVLTTPWLLLFIAASALFVFLALSRINADATAAATPASDDDYRALFDASPDPQWLYDVDSGLVQAANAAAARLYGLSPETLTGLRADTLLSPLPLPSADPMRLTHQPAGGLAVELETRIHEQRFASRSCRLVTVHQQSRQLRAESRFAEALA